MKMLLEAADLSTIESLKKAISRGQVAGIKPFNVPSDKILEKILLSLKDVDKKYKNASIVLALNKHQRNYLVAKRKFNPKAYEYYFQYKNNKELKNSLNGFERGYVTDTEFIKKVEIETQDVSKEVDKLYEDDEWLLLHPKTYKASCKYGKNTRWCTTMNTEMYRKYPGLLIIINKKNNEKYQTDAKSEMFNDEMDKLVDFQNLLNLFNRFPIGLKEILAKKNIKAEENEILKMLGQNNVYNKEKIILPLLKKIYYISQYGKNVILFYAISNGYIKTVKYMLEKGANPNYFINRESVLEKAYREGKPEIFELLLKNGAKTLPEEKLIAPKTVNKETKKQMNDLYKKYRKE
jgi:hypothetical protein